MGRNDPRGSLWRQWDLHFHTPSSGDDYDNGGVTNEDIVGGLRAAGVSAVAITDHHVIDVDRVHSLQELGEGDLTVFPGIELRTDLGDKSVHFVGMFPEDSNVEEIWTTLQGRLSLHPDTIAKKGADSVYVSYGDAAEAVHDQGGLVSVHAGRKAHGSIEQIRGVELCKYALKRDLVREHIDILEIGQLRDVDDYHRIVFPKIGVHRPLVICSDNHDITSYERKAPCWIKADPTFAGLCQITHEPLGRVFLGDEPEILKRVQQNRTKYVRSVEMVRTPDAALDEAWFDQTVELNPGLIAIIGNKGGGKSALADILGLLGDTQRSEEFSFLCRDRFRQPKFNKAEHFQATLTWESGDAEKKNLNDRVDPNSVERIKYIPQNYLETICNELSTAEKSSFTEELKAVIFSHVDDAHRLGKETLDELVDYRTSETREAVGMLRVELRETIQELVALEEKQTDAYQRGIMNRLRDIEAELKAHENSRPQEVAKPESDAATQERIEKVAQEIESKAAEVTKLEAEIAALMAAQKELVKKSSIAGKLLSRIDNFKTQFRAFKAQSSVNCSVLGLDFDNIVKFDINEEPVKALKDDLDGQARTKADLLDKTNENGPRFKVDVLEKHIAQLKDKLDEPNRRYQAFLKATKDWETRKLAIVGDKDTPGTLEYIKHLLKLLEHLPRQVEATKEALIKQVLSIYREIAKLAGVYRDLYKPVQDFIAEHDLARERFKMEFRVDIILDGFEESFLAFINQSRRGSFMGLDEGRQRLRGLVEKSDFGSEEGVKAFLSEITRHLRSDLRGNEEEPPKVEVADQLNKGVNKTDLYDFLFSLGYLRPDYALLWSGKEVEELSPGERGTLLLVFYLLIDHRDIPLIADQPEENLDNQTIFDILVPSIKEAKDRRQIIIVTHNPNLAVVCDAEQIIWASLNKDDRNRVTYVTGAIENPEINRKVVDILEGTMPAFDNRDAKYHIVEQEQTGIS